MTREEPGVIHSLGLPRDLVGKLLNVFEQSPKAPEDNELRRIFGAAPYTFFEEVVPAFREFGRKNTGKARRRSILQALSTELRSLITEEQANYKTLFGFYKDELGRTYKFERNEHVSVKYEYHEEMPWQRNDEVVVEHLDVPGYRVRFVIDDDMLTGKSRTVLMKYTPIEVFDPRQLR